MERGSDSGAVTRRPGVVGAARDLATDLATTPRRVALTRAALAGAPQRVLAISVARPERAGSAAAAAHELERSRVHTVDVRLAAPRPGAGLWATLDAVLEHNPPAGYDWLIVFDDDVILPRGFLDVFLYLGARFGLTLAQPAHKHWSHGAWPEMRRRARTLVRKVPPGEIGPVLGIHASAFGAVLPFADGRLDAEAVAHGIVDATPIRRTRQTGAPRPAPPPPSVESPARG
jgi:hypothetical protein